MSGISIWDCLLRSDAELRRLGVPAKHIAATRRAYTGHTRRVHPVWASTIGMWGRVRTAEEIAERTGRDIAAVRNHASTAGLKYATRNKQCTPAGLAVRLYCDRDRPAEESARHHGVLLGERVLYLAATQTMLELCEVRIEDLLGWSVDRLHLEWWELGLDIDRGARRSPSGPCKLAIRIKEIVEWTKREAAGYGAGATAESHIASVPTAPLNTDVGVRGHAPDRLAGLSGAERQRRIAEIVAEVERESAAEGAAAALAESGIEYVPPDALDTGISEPASGSLAGPEWRRRVEEIVAAAEREVEGNAG